MSLNKVTISGNLGDMPELRHTNSGTPVCSLSVCVNQRVKSGGEWKDKPNWVKVTFWGKRAEAIANNLKKGQHVAIIGRLDQNKWQDAQGNKYSRLEVIGEDIEWHSSKADKSSQPVVDESVYDSDVPF